MDPAAAPPVPTEKAGGDNRGRWFCQLGCTNAKKGKLVISNVNAECGHFRITGPAEKPTFFNKKDGRDGRDAISTMSTYNNTERASPAS